jgi:DNA polymerase-1
MDLDSIRYNVITTESALSEFVAAYSRVKAFAYDTETIGEHRVIPKINDVCWIQFATDDPDTGEVRVDVIPMGHPNGEFLHWNKPLLPSAQKRIAKGLPITDAHFTKSQKLWKPVFSAPPTQLNPRQVFDAIKPLMFGRATKVGHNLKFDHKSIAKYFRTGLFAWKVPTGPHFDTLMASFIVDNRNKHKLDLLTCVKRELKIEIVKGVGENVALHSFDDVAKYSAIDAFVTWLLYKALAPRLAGNLRKVWKLEMDLLPALCDMELSGAPVDVEHLDTIEEEVSRGVMAAEAKCYVAAGKPFAINSGQVKQKLLYAPGEDGSKPRLKPNPRVKVALTPKGQQLARDGHPLDWSHFATSAEALEFHRGKDKLVDALLEYADLNKLLTTYVIPYKGGTVKRVTNGKEKFVEKPSLLVNGRAHTQFNAHGAETGRFSSTNPNLQNIPSRGKYAKLVRNMFAAPPGYKFIVADYSQIEPRVIASFSGDPTLVHNYLTGGDVYRTIADPLGKERAVGKVLVLAMSYGIGPDKVAGDLGITVTEAKALMNAFEKMFPEIGRYKSKVVRAAKSHSPMPYVETIFGRRRYIPELLSREPGLISSGERKAFNTVIQGSAADIMKLAIVRAHSCFVDEPDINVLLTVHDELVVITPEDRAEETAEAVRVSMEGISLQAITVPLKAEVYIVDKWGEAK